MNDFLKHKMEFSDPQIEELIQSAGLKNAKSLNNKLQFLCTEYKISPISLKKMLKRTTVALTYSPEAIKEKYNFFLQSFGFSPQEFGRLIAKQPRILTYSTLSIEKKMQSYGRHLYMSPKDAKRFILSCPSIFGYNEKASLKKIAFLKKIGVTNKAILKKPMFLSLPAKKITERMAICECMGLSKRKFVSSGCLMVDEKRLYARAYIQNEEKDYALLASSNSQFKKTTGINEKLLMELCEYGIELQEHYASYYEKRGIDINAPLPSREKVEKLAEQAENEVK